MEKRVACTKEDLVAAIIKFLRRRGDVMVDIKDVASILQKDFVFSNIELCETLNRMSWDGLLNFTLHVREDEGFSFTALQIQLNQKKDKETLNAATKADLVSLMVIEINKPRLRGLVVAIINLWDGRIVNGLYYKGKNKPDMATDFTSIADKSILLELVERKLLQNESFITRTGTGNDVIVIEWSISAAE